VRSKDNYFFFYISSKAALGVRDVRIGYKQQNRLEKMSGRWKGSTLQLKTIEAGGGGDCLFHAIARGMTDWLGKEITMMNIREELAKSITSDNARRFIRHICEDHKLFLPRGSVDWNLLRFHRQNRTAARQARRLVRQCGTSFQGTDVVLRQLLAYSPFLRKAGIGCVAANAFGPGFSGIYPCLEKAPLHWYIILYCSNNTHWQAATIRTARDGRVGVLSLAQLTEVMPSL
jgi:hypothetical protein